MATYSLSGTGVQALSSNVTAVHVDITTHGLMSGKGTANPLNYFHEAMLRFGDAVGYFDAIPVAGGPQWLAVPFGTTRLGYACQNGAAISVVEVIGGTPPFGSTGALSSLTDVALASPTNGQVLAYQSSTSHWVNSTPGGSSPIPYVRAIDAKTSGTGGGNPTTGAWTDRTLNTLVDDTQSIASLASNHLTLPAGTYQMRGSFPVYKTGRTGGRLRDITHGTTLLDGASGYAGTATESEFMLFGAGIVVLSSSTAIAIQYYANNNEGSGFGLGVDAGSGITGGVRFEVYAQLEAFKLA